MMNIPVDIPAQLSSVFFSLKTKVENDETYTYEEEKVSNFTCFRVPLKCHND